MLKINLLRLSRTSKVSPLFLMKTTNFKDSVKVHQILPIMQEHFGQSMNLARIKLMALLLHTLCVVQTISLHKLTDAMPTSVDKDSNLRRLQRFNIEDNHMRDMERIARLAMVWAGGNINRPFASDLFP